jgi:hypothetical protein
MVRHPLPGLAFALLLCWTRTATAQAGTRSPAISLSLTAAQPAFISVTVVSGASPTIPVLAPGALNSFPTPTRIQTSWNLRTGSGTLSLVGWFSTPGLALANGATAIPASRVQGRVATGRPRNFTAFTQGPRGGVGVAGGSLELWRYRVCNSVACRRRTRTDNLELRLNLVGFPLAAGSYAGTLNLRAVTY